LPINSVEIILYIHTVKGKEHPMSLQSTAIPSTTTSYELAGRRLQALIAAPGVQKRMAVTVSRLEHEAEEDWQRLIDEISETDGVMVESLQGGAIRIGWKQYCDA
jgi:hypothetical protein